MVWFFSLTLLIDMLTRKVVVHVVEQVARQWGGRAATPLLFYSRPMSNVVEEHLQKMAQNDKRLTESYGKIKGDFSAKEVDEIRRRRVIYRAKQRGWLEADILLGSWAKENVSNLSEDELTQFETILQEETIDLYNFVSGKDPLPDHLKALPVMAQLTKYAQQTKIDDPASYGKR